MKKSGIQFGTLAAGIITALAIVLSQLFCFQTVDHSKKETKTEQQETLPEDQQDNQVYISPLPSSSLPSSAYVELTQEIFCLFEILFFEENEPGDYDNKVPLPLNKLFQTLFESIISPNAP